MVHRAMLPQIILVQWHYPYNNVTRAEYRGTGFYGNRSAAPNVGASEFAAVLFWVVGNEPGAEGRRSRALEISGLGGEELALAESWNLRRRVVLCHSHRAHIRI